ncbi:hypothetical protein CRV02_13575 [Arcobacter sp. CECT 8989]|uniref:hypothetical protein n=1 Tax=Arcobacter sp. CECT 8989 TaxID=2044509 RepID=UPI00100A70D3|nr:hypothetical protein [Arcobacter sp. CECT 8989]RXJ98274.1 hypothetical protein CRV02_13575 [Arcobacter sp. CECT 8989]
MIYELLFSWLQISFKNNHKKLWKNFFDTNLKKHYILYKNENAYLKKFNLDKEQVIRNSIESFYPNLDDYYISCLIEYFELFTINNKIRILKKDDLEIPIYLEVIEALTYIRKIDSIIEKSPKRDGNHHGTRHRQSSIKNLINTQLNILRNRLDNPFFSISNEDEISKTKFQIKFIEASLKDKYKNLPEWLNFIKINVGFDNSLLEFTNNEIEAFNQLTYFFNGIKTSNEELIKSVTIILKEKSNIKSSQKEYHKKLVESIYNLTYFFFEKDIQSFELKNKKRTFSYKEKNITRQTQIKTFLYDTPIYTYKNKTSKDALEELFEIGLDSIFGIQTMLEEDKEVTKEISEFKELKNFLRFLKKLGIKKDDLKQLSKLLETQQIK